MTDAASGYSARSVQIPFEKLGLQVGDPLFLEASDHSARYSVRLVGYQSGVAVIVTQPMVEGRQLLLPAGKPLTVRSAVKNKVFAFNSGIRHVSMQPFAHLFLDFPREMLALEIRNAERVRVDIQAEMTSDFDSGLGEWPKPVLVSDLSRTGASVICRRELGREGDELMLRCRLSVCDVTKQFSLKCLIRAIERQEAEEGYVWRHGLQFLNLSDAAKIMLTGFLYEQQASR